MDCDSRGSRDRIAISLKPLIPRKPICAPKIRASRRLVMTTFTSPVAWTTILETTPNSSRSCCTSLASLRLRVEYEICTVDRGSMLAEPSPVKSARRNIALTAGTEVQMNSGTFFSALRNPSSSPRRVRRSADTSWTSSSCSREPDAMVCRYTYRGPPTTMSNALRTSSKNSRSVLLKPAREAEKKPSLTQAPARSASALWWRVAVPYSHGCGRARTTRSPGRISSRRLHNSVGTRATDRSVKTGWLCVPVTS